jgi:L-threonylcarbamoyladenylate synthase
MNIQSSVTIYPTDTVWGIGASIYDQNAYKEISRIKKTNEDKPLSVMFTDIDHLMKSFSFPKEMTKEWLSIFFSMESTLGLPLLTAKIRIPPWVHGSSDMVSVRLSSNPNLKTMTAPFFTTSLNITGQPPITTLSDAEKFWQIHAPSAKFISTSSLKLSGESSTIVFFKDKAFHVIRKGRLIEEIKKHLELTGFVCS